mmetsp:Transcript_6940/g.12161  ORF Transcript_6940/g.12161 Transcript_6940/m.12161 type:complete len:550 (+) Transcript_6940:164-1813(+)
MVQNRYRHVAVTPSHHETQRGLMLRMNLMCVAILLSCSLASLHAVASAFSPCRNCISQKYRGPRLITTRFNSDSDSDTTSSNAFTASPITITSTIPSAASKSDNATTKVNSATLQFNNRLNRMAKSVDATTAPKVEALLLEAVKNYQQSQIENEQGGQNTNQTIAPNTVSFTNAITAWARCTQKDSAKRAEALLDQMHSLYKKEGWEHVRPNKISYNSVITAWARSRDRGSARQGEELLRSMYEFYNEEGGEDDDLKPDSRSWNAVINAVARSRDDKCADRAKFLLDEMGRLYNEGDDDLLPDALTFGAIINAYANSFEEGASDKAAQLLMHMESLYQLGFENAKPTTFVYNACMNAFAKDPLNSIDNAAPAAEKAEQILNSMEKRYREEKDHRVMPDCISYSTVINAYANSNTPQSGIHADAILRRMINRYLLGDTKCRPNAVAFTAAIKAHSAAMKATLSSDEGVDAQNNVLTQQIGASARRCEDLLQQLCLMYQNQGNDRSLKPTSVTFDLVNKALTQAKDWEGVERVKMLRSEAIKMQNNTRRRK